MKKRKPIPKKVREQVYNMFNGHCAYCGCKLEYKDMQVDHVESVYRSYWNGKETNDTLENYMPSCRMCNYYKGAYGLESFRKNLTNMLMRNVRKPFDYRLAVKYGLIQETIHPIKFYFEEYGENRKESSSVEGGNSLSQ